MVVDLDGRSGKQADQYTITLLLFRRFYIILSDQDSFIRLPLRANFSSAFLLFTQKKPLIFRVNVCYQYAKRLSRRPTSS